MGKTCKWGASCSFAHGKSELRVRNQKEELKIKSCRGYNETGFCSYGVRCQFLHSKPFRTHSEKLDVFEITMCARIEENETHRLADKIGDSSMLQSRLPVFRTWDAMSCQTASPLSSISLL